MNDQQLLRYSRHLLLEDIGHEAQERLIAASVLVVGAGGLGSPATMYLASAGVGRILLADDDVVDLTNLQRQILHRLDGLGLPKAQSGRRTVAELNPDVEVVPIEQRLAGETLERSVRDATVVLDCSDNFETRHAINRACVAAGVPLVSGAAIRFDGQLAVFDPRDRASPCYHCLFPEGLEVEAVRCAVMGVFAPLTGIVGTMQAAEALKLAGGFGTPMTGRLLLVDARSMRFDEIAVPRRPDCPVCGIEARATPPGTSNAR
ncbi:MAG: molybdopterin-synthase adenylyltransferase MoeB [Burkholderiaceae bacterium]